MRTGTLEVLGEHRLVRGSKYVGFKAPATITAASSFVYTLPGDLPGSSSTLLVGTDGTLSYGASGGTGTVTSVALTAPNIFTVSGSPVTSSGTLALSLASQSGNTFFAGPNGSAGTPTFRSIVFADVSSLVGTTANTLAAGNDSRFHTQNTDTGTTQVSFQIQSGSSGPRIKNSSGEVQLRNAADNAFADLRVQNLFVEGTTTTVNSETVTIADNIIELNSNVTTGTPTEDAGLSVRRGSSANSQLLWNESTDLWNAGIVGDMVQVARVKRTTFTNANLVSGTFTYTHGLGATPVITQIRDNNNRLILPDEFTDNATQTIVDLTSFGSITGTWTLTVIG